LSASRSQKLELELEHELGPELELEPEPELGRERRMLGVRKGGIYRRSGAAKVRQAAPSASTRHLHLCV
jgi:hypothetical protein